MVDTTKDMAIVVMEYIDDIGNFIGGIEWISIYPDRQDDLTRWDTLTPPVIPQGGKGELCRK